MRYQQKTSVVAGLNKRRERVKISENKEKLQPSLCVIVAQRVNTTECLYENGMRNLGKRQAKEETMDNKKSLHEDHPTQLQTHHVNEKYKKRLNHYTQSRLNPAACAYAPSDEDKIPVTKGKAERVKGGIDAAKQEKKA